ncbi:DMT family transporter [soil metagenome]
MGIAAAVAAVLAWTAFILIARASATRSLGAFDLGFLRICGAGAVLVPWGAWLAMRDRREHPATARSALFGLSPLGLRITVIAGAIGGLGYALIAYTGFFFAPAAHASVLLPGSLPLWTSLLAIFVLRDRITGARALGLGLILAGDLVVGGRSLMAAFDGGEVWKGDLLFMGTSFCWAVYTVTARRFRLEAVRATIAITVFAFLTYLPVYAVLVAGGWVSSRIGSAPWSEVLFQLTFQGLLSVVVAGIAFTRMIQYFGPVRSTMITALVPCLSALGAVLLLGEPLHWSLLAGLVLVTAGILFGVRPGRAAPTVSSASSTVVAGGRCNA